MNATELKAYQITRRSIAGRPFAEVPSKMKDCERQVIYGAMLGDGGTVYDKRVKNGNECFMYGHCSEQKELTKWVGYYLYRWNPKFKNRVQSDKQYGTRYSVRIITPYCQLFTIIGHKFYKRDKNNNYILKEFGKGKCRIKILPDDVLYNLNSLGLAVWYMDDGCYCLKNENITISTLSFSEEENYRIADWFMSKWGIDARVHKEKSSYHIYIVHNSNSIFLNIIRPWVKQVQCMDYKLGALK